jgi:chemotaxis protein methyltransferase CheR
VIHTIAGREAEPAVTAAGELSPKAFQRIAEIVRQEARIELPPSKITLVHSRLSRRLREHRLASFSDYVALVPKSGRR